MPTIKQEVRLRLQAPSRFAEDHDDVIRPAYGQVWRDASRLASPRRYNYAGAQIDIEVDWSVVARRRLEDAEVAARRAEAEAPIPAHSHQEGDLFLPAVVTLTGDNDTVVEYAEWPAFLRYHLTNVFLALNLAAPGSATFQLRGADHRFDMDLHGSDFEFAWLASLDGVGPPVGSIDLEKCFRWIAPLEERFVHVARSRRERVAVALLEVAGIECSPFSALWLWYALEALFRTSKVNVFGQVHRGICHLIGANHVQSVMLEKSLSELFQLRSQFTHGKLSIIHPYSVDQSGEEVDAEMTRYADAHIAGVRTLLACAQAFVRIGVS